MGQLLAKTLFVGLFEFYMRMGCNAERRLEAAMNEETVLGLKRHRADGNFFALLRGAAGAGVIFL